MLDTADQFEVRLTWLCASPLLPGRRYHYKSRDGDVLASVTSIKFRFDAGSGANLAAKVLQQGETGTVNLSLAAPIAYVCLADNPVASRFSLFDERGAEVGRGEIEFALHRAANIHWQTLEIDKAARAASKNQAPRCIWLTGLSGSGKSTIANVLEKRLFAEDRHTYTLDGDNVRHGLNRDLGFTDADRVENIRRVAEVARLMVDAGLIVLVSFISPFRAERELARTLFAKGEFIEVFVDAPLAACEARDPKGLYAKARRCELKNFTGIDSDYEAPESPEIHLRTSVLAPEACVELVIAYLSDAC